MGRGHQSEEGCSCPSCAAEGASGQAAGREGPQVARASLAGNAAAYQGHLLHWGPWACLRQEMA